MESGTPALPSLLDSATRFLAWWREELWGLVPERLRGFLEDSHADAVLTQVGGGYQLIMDRTAWTGGRDPEVLSRAQALAALADLAASRRVRRAGIRVPLTLCFERRVELPRVSRNDLRRMLDFDMERATPFKPTDVYTAHLATGEAAAAGKQRLRQIVVKREVIETLVADVKAAGAEPIFADCWQTAPLSGLPINFLEADSAPPHGIGRYATLSNALAATAVLLAATAYVVWPSKYETALAEIDAQTTKARIAAAAVRSTTQHADAAVAELVRLQQMKARQAPAIEILEELSRVLPDSVWLTDFRLQGDTVDVTGLAKSGAALPSLFVGSALFADAALTAPLTLDQREDKERFSLRIRIKQAEATPATAIGND